MHQTKNVKSIRPVFDSNETDFKDVFNVFILISTLLFLISSKFFHVKMLHKSKINSK